MFRWLKKIIGESHPIGREAFNREDELRDKDYLGNYTGEKNGTVFENANCHVKFFYHGITSSGHHIICGKNTIFKSGKVISGNYRCQTWEGGEFCGDTLQCRFFEGGIFRGKHLVCEQFLGGEFLSGVAECNSWENAEFKGDVLVCQNWRSGIFSGNVFHGTWRGGVWKGKHFTGIDLSGSGLELHQ